FADQAVIAIENVRLFKELEARNRDLTATSDILQVIANSPTDAQPVFDAIARNAVALCGGIAALVLRFDGEMLRVAGIHAMSPEGVELNERTFPRRPGRDYPSGRAFLDRSVVHIPDLQAASEFATSSARQRGAGSLLAVPLLQEGEAIGVIGLARIAAGPFSPQQIEMFQTFAAQAVIAIENVRLFTELEARNHDLTRALARETATSEILRVISSSPTDVQPVFDAIVRNAGRLCGAASAALNIAEGAVQRKVAEFGPESFVLRIGESRPIPRTSLAGRPMLEGRTIHIDDIQDAAVMQEYPDTRYPPGTQGCLATPLLHEGSPPVGVLFVFRTKGGPFTDTHSALLKTFADQAVIAIENVRLFTELQEKNQALTQAHAQVSEALEQQTATAGILRVISSSPTDVQPVFEAIAANAARLCDAVNGLVIRFDGQFLHLAAQY